ncbi:hypothetical protein LB507_011338 [Fusarium sp. FIESC RH6]|nr:hypothetical protein LB507_011338 [Fusarium sp. FIESC RH6]
MTGLEPSIEESDTSIDPVQETIDPVQETVDLCSELDSCCVITGSSLAIVTLIVPFNYDGSDEDLEYTKSLAPALSAIIDNPNGEEPLEHLKTLFKHQGSTYQPWNAICINRDLQQLWTSGLCALKWLNAVALQEDPSKSRIRLQFHWLYPNDSIPMPDVTLQDDKETRDDIYSSEDFYISARDHESGRQIESGDICTIIRFTEDMDKCKQMFDIQWAISNAACESGFTAEVDLDEEVEWDLDVEEFPGQDDEWEMTDGSECS